MNPLVTVERTMEIVITISWNVLIKWLKWHTIVSDTMLVLYRLDWIVYKLCSQCPAWCKSKLHGSSPWWLRIYDMGHMSIHVGCRLLHHTGYSLGSQLTKLVVNSEVTKTLGKVFTPHCVWRFCLFASAVDRSNTVHVTWWSKWFSSDLVGGFLCY